jgi:hypothetical protein
VKPDIRVAQLSIIDGAWQEAPDHLACFDAAALFEGALERGNLYIVVEVAGEPEGRDRLARELIETVRREYAATRGSIALGLMQAIRAANDFFYTVNASLSPEARRIGGITAVILRGDELFIAQGGPGVTCVVRGKTLARYPEESHWFNPDEAAVAEWLGSRDFVTPGEVPLGMRRNYIPDIFHTTLAPGDTVVLATRALVHLLTDEELIDTLANRHPDEIVNALEDVAGAMDLSVIVIQRAGEARAAVSPTPLPSVEIAPQGETQSPASDVVAPVEEELAWQQIRAERERERQRLQEERARARRQEIFTSLLRGAANAMRALAGLGARVDWTRLGNMVDRALDALVRGLARTLVFLIRAITPGEPKENKPARPSTQLQTAWKLAALVLPLVLIFTGIVTWGMYRADQQAAQERRLTQLVNNANGLMEEAKRLQPTDRVAAREAVRRALELLEQARALRANDPRVASAVNRAQDLLDELNGISVIFSLPTFATFADKSQITRIVARASDVFLFDRGLQRVYRYVVNESGSSATPASSDGVILKSGDRVGNRTVGEIFDVVWLDAGRLVVLDRTGAYYQFDASRNTWSARAANEPAAWARATMAATYANNLYLIDPSRNQILKYVSPTPDVTWTASVTYFAPGVTPPDLSTAIDLVIDGEVWIIRADGSVSRFYEGRPREITLSGLDAPIAKPLALITTERMTNLYVVDAGNPRVLQFDKVTGRLARQFKPHSQGRDAFKALQAFAVDEPNRRFVFVSAGKAYLATIPQ